MRLHEWAGKIRALDGTSYPGNTTVEIINKPAFEKAKGTELDYIMEVEKASFLMLCQTDILKENSRAQLAKALMRFPYNEVRAMPYDKDYAEDMFFAVEKKLSENAGECATNLHLGRSRNDMMRTVNKMLIRQKLIELHEKLNDLVEVLIALAYEHVDTLMPGYTHTQQAQPTTLAHYLSGLIHVLERDTQRVQNAINTIQLCPMGAGALTTTSFAIDRQMLCSLLGFSDVMENSYDAVCSSDFLTEPAAALGILAGNLGRFVMHLHVWSAQEYNFLKQSRAYVGISSMMPQKRNPSTVEHIRTNLSDCVGKSFTLQVINHNCEFEGNIDICVAPGMLCEVLTEACQSITLLTHICATLEVDKKTLQSRVMESFTVMTDFADLLVKKEGIDYRNAHHIASYLVDMCCTENRTLSGIDDILVKRAFFHVMQREMQISFEEVQKVLDARNSVTSHQVPGGPSEISTRHMLDGSMRTLDKNEIWIEHLKEKLTISHATLERSVLSYVELN